MPRLSVESRSAASWRARADGPSREPLAYLPEEAKTPWREVIASKTADWFDAGSLALLKQYCQIAARTERLVQRLNELDRKKPANIQQQMLIDVQATKLEERIHKHAMSSGSLAARLRLSVQAAVDWHSRKLNECGVPPHPLLSGRDH